MPFISVMSSFSLGETRPQSTAVPKKYRGMGDGPPNVGVPGTSALAVTPKGLPVGGAERRSWEDMV